MSSKNNIDIQKLHLSPLPVQIMAACIVGVLIVVAAYFLSFQSQMETLTAAQEEETSLRDKYQNLTIKVANLENLQTELKLIEESISELIKQLPTESDLPDLIQELHHAAAGNGLTLTHVIPRPAQTEDANIKRLPFSISVTGSYDKLASFQRDVGRMTRIVTLSSINIVPEEDKNSNSTPNKVKQKPSNKFVLTAIASTYKAVDTDLPASAASAASAAAPAPAN